MSVSECFLTHHVYVSVLSAWSEYKVDSSDSRNARRAQQVLLT